jgi:D-3-phosphoglycerate dehydrogenase
MAPIAGKSRRRELGMNGKFKVGIVAPPVERLDVEQEALGPGIELVRLSATREEDLDPTVLGELDGLLLWRIGLSERTAECLKRCRIVARFSVGYDNVDVGALARHGILFANNPDYGTEEVADTALAMILTLQRRLPLYDKLMRAGEATWRAEGLPSVRRSRGLTVGVVGVGRIGTAVVNRLKPFGYHVLGYDPYQPAGHEKAIGYERVDALEPLLAASDIVTLHCPLTEETAGLINRASLDKVRPGAMLVNTARGPLLADLDVLEQALRSGLLSAAGLDVLPEEPPKPHPLLDAWRRREDWIDGRLVITPHVAFYADEAFVEQRRKPCETVRLCLIEGRTRNLIAAE